MTVQPAVLVLRALLLKCGSAAIATGYIIWMGPPPIVRLRRYGIVLSTTTNLWGVEDGEEKKKGPRSQQDGEYHGVFVECCVVVGQKCLGR